MIVVGITVHFDMKFRSGCFATLADLERRDKEAAARLHFLVTNINALVFEHKIAKSAFFNSLPFIAVRIIHSEAIGKLPSHPTLPRMIQTTCACVFN